MEEGFKKYIKLHGHGHGENKGCAQLTSGSD